MTSTLRALGEQNYDGGDSGWWSMKWLMSFLPVFQILTSAPSCPRSARLEPAPTPREASSARVPPATRSLPPDADASVKAAVRETQTLVETEQRSVRLGTLRCSWFWCCCRRCGCKALGWFRTYRFSISSLVFQCTYADMWVLGWVRVCRALC